MADPRILVVADSDEATHLTSVLREAGLSLLDVAHGGAGTVAAFENNPASIIVITATLEEVETDVQELCEALRAAATPAPSIVLVGDEHGPVRTALDAMAYGVERFLQRPLSPKALTFAVRSCATTGHAQSAATNGQGIGGLAMGVAQGQVNMAATLGETSRAKGGAGARMGMALGGVGAHAIDVRIEKVTSQAIDDFINDAVDNVLATTRQAATAKKKKSLIENLDAGWEDAWLAPLRAEEPRLPVPSTAIAKTKVSGLTQGVAEQQSQATRTAAPTALKINRKRIMARHALVAEGDYFAVLGVRRDASELEIKRAYETARADYAAETFAGELQKELAPQLREIVQVLQEAYRVLRDDRVRERYVANLEE